MTDAPNRVADALRYWEPRRLIYNGVLAGVVLTHLYIAHFFARTALWR